MTLHDLRDIVDIYYSGKDGKVDYTWDRTPIKVWNPSEQRNMEIYFTGSARPGADGEKDPGQINFNVRYVDELGENCVFDAFNKVIGKIIDSRFDMSIDWEKEYVKQIYELRNAKKDETK